MLARSRSTAMTQDLWTAVDDYIGAAFGLDDPALTETLAASEAAGLPPIAVSPAQGKLLHILARMLGARRILEVGTLGGYSTIWMARALPDDGRLTTLEIDPKHAETARASLAKAGLGHKVEVKVGPALESLASLHAAGEAPFDLVFIDADKQNNAAYFDWALKLTRPGALILVDNVVREGRVLNPDGDAMVQGVRRFYDRIKGEPKVTATAIQTVGLKGWDGLAVALVN
jgi:predicted O-methyltransferase YrrM